MVVPDGQDGEHVSCKTAMDRNERRKDTRTFPHSPAESNRLIPGGKQLGCQRLPSRGKIGDEQVSLWPQDGSVLPCPADQMHSSLSKLLDGLLLDGIKWLAKADQSWKGELHMMEKLLYLLFHAIGSTFTELCKQVQESIQLLVPFSASNNPLIFEHDNSQE